MNDIIRNTSGKKTPNRTKIFSPRLFTKVFLSIISLVLGLLLIIYLVAIPLVESAMRSAEERAGLTIINNVFNLIEMADEDVKQYRLAMIDERKNKMKDIITLTEITFRFNYNEALAAGKGKKTAFMRMPEVDGLGATKLIRSLESGKTIPIIAVTASAFEHEKDRILEAGLNGYISKPFKLDEIFNVLREHLKVEYEYADTSEKKTRNSSEIDPLTTEAISMIPGDIRQKIYMAAERADIDGLIMAISKVENYNASVAGALLELTRQFDFERLLDIFNQKEE